MEEHGANSSRRRGRPHRTKRYFAVQPLVFTDEEDRMIAVEIARMMANWPAQRWNDWVLSLDLSKMTHLDPDEIEEVPLPFETKRFRLVQIKKSA